MVVCCIYISKESTWTVSPFCPLPLLCTMQLSDWSCPIVTIEYYWIVSNSNFSLPTSNFPNWDGQLAELCTLCFCFSRLTLGLLKAGDDRKVSSFVLHCLLSTLFFSFPHSVFQFFLIMYFGFSSLCISFAPLCILIFPHRVFKFFLAVKFSFSSLYISVVEAVSVSLAVVF